MELGALMQCAYACAKVMASAEQLQEESGDVPFSQSVVATDLAEMESTLWSFLFLTSARKAVQNFQYSLQS